MTIATAIAELVDGCETPADIEAKLKAADCFSPPPADCMVHQTCPVCQWLCLKIGGPKALALCKLQNSPFGVSPDDAYEYDFRRNRVTLPHLLSQFIETYDKERTKHGNGT